MDKHPMKDNDPIEYEALTDSEEEINGAVDVLKLAFTLEEKRDSDDAQIEVMGEHLGLTQKEMAPYLKWLCRKAARERLTSIARNSKGQVVGVMLSDDLMDLLDDSKQPPSEVLTDKFIIIVDLLMKLDNTFLDTLDPDERRRGRYFHQYMTGILPEYRNKNIAQTLIAKNIQLGREAGFQWVCGEVTGPLIQRTVIGLHGISEAASVIYRDYKNGDDKKPFKNIDQLPIYQHLRAKMKKDNAFGAKFIAYVNNPRCCFVLQRIDRVQNLSLPTAPTLAPKST
jgi:hypothetical protein